MAIWLIHASESTNRLLKIKDMNILFIALCLLLVETNALYYDGLSSYSIYPRLDLHICRNSTFSFDFTVSTSLNKYLNTYKSSNKANDIKNSPKLLIYSEQQIRDGEAYKNFMVKLVNEQTLVISDYWSMNEVKIKLPIDFATSWFRFVYTRYLNKADISLYKYEPQDNSTPSLLRVYSKQFTYSNYIEKARAFQTSYSQLLVGGIDQDNSNKFGSLSHVSNFHGYIMNLQYISDHSSQCTVDNVCMKPEGQRHYAIFSSSTSKKYKLKQSLMMDDICESDTLIHDMCPKDCSCLSNNFQAPFFSCDCKSTISRDILDGDTSEEQCNLMFKSLEINFDDSTYFSSNAENFEYPMLPTFVKTSVENKGTKFNKFNGIEFNSPTAHLNFNPVDQFLDAESACFWNIDNCVNGFVQHLIMSIDHIDDSKFNQKVMLLVNGHQSEENSSKFIAYIHKNRLYFSIFEADKNIEWLVSSPVLSRDNYVNRPLKVTLTWVREESFSLHFDGFLIDMTLKPLTSPLNSDIYSAKNFLNKHTYEIGIKLLNSQKFTENSNYRSSHLDFAIASSLINHQFTIKYMRRDYYNKQTDYEISSGSQDSKIIVSSPLPSEIIRIDNTQRVMYKIDSPLTGVTKETIDLAFKTSQSNGVVFYITNNPIVSYFELVDGMPVAVIDTRYKNVNLKPIRSPRLDDNRWHEVKLHRDGQKIGITIDSQYYDNEDLGSGYNQILTGGHVYLGIADPTNINLSHKKPFNGEMVRGKVTINNVQQRVEQKPYEFNNNVAWSGSSVSGITTNQTVNIDTSQLVRSKDGKHINIIINVYGPPGFSVNGVSSQGSSSLMETADTHYIYLDKLPNTRFVSVGSTDTEIDFRVTSTRLDKFLIKFQTRQSSGQLCTLINNRNNFVGLEIYNGYVYSSSSNNGKIARNQISRVRVDDGRIYQVNMKQEQEKLLCWLDADDSYKSSILYYNPISINNVRIAGQDGSAYGYSSQTNFVGCIGSVILNDRDVIDINYQYVPMERKQSCEKVIEISQPTTSPAPLTETPVTHSVPQPVRPPSLGYISFSGAQDILTYNFFYDHEKPNFEDISFIFRTVTPYGILFSAHNDDNHRPKMIGAYLKDGKVHVVYVNSTLTQYSQDLHFEHTRVDDGSLYRLNIRRNANGQGFIQLQSYESVKALEFFTEPGKIKLTKILVGGADQWSRNRFFATRPDFIGCIIDLFQINGNSVIKPAEIPKQRYNCQIDMKNRPTKQPVTEAKRPKCLPDGYPVSFSRVSDAITYQHETSVCDHIHVPFRTRTPRGILYSHSSNDGRFFIVVFLKRGFVNIIVRDSTSIEKELELSTQRVDDGQLHKLDINCENGFIIVYVDQNRNVLSNRLDLESPLYFNTYTIGYFNQQVLSSKFSRFDNFQGCIEQVSFNDECLIHERLIDRSRLSCDVQPVSIVEHVTQSPIQKPQSCANTCTDTQCLIELAKNSYVLYNARDAGARPSTNTDHDSIHLMFRVLDTNLKDQELITIFNYDRSIRVYLENGLPVVELRGQKFSKLDTRYNDGKWHQLILEKHQSDLMIKVDEKGSSVQVPFAFDLYGDGRIYFGSTVGVDSYFHGLLKDVYVKYSNIEYDIVSASTDQRIPGVTCAGNVLIKSNEDSSVDEIKESLSTWRFRGINSGDIEFVPYLQSAQEAELDFHFNTSMTNGNILCTKDDTLALNVELVNSILAVSVTDIRTRRVLQTTNCRPKPGNYFNDNDLHKVQIVKKGINQFEISCDDQEAKALYFRQRHGEDVPFVATKYGISFGVGCFEQGRKFKGDLSKIVYVHEGVRHSFDDLQYSEDPRFSYEGYVEFRPEFITQVFSDPKPISFRSKLSSAKLKKWDQSKVGRLSFEFKQEVTGENGFLFSTESDGTYFAIIINDGYLESVLSPHRTTSTGSSNYYDRFQRLFPKPNKKVNDGNWHRIEFSMEDDTVGSFVLDDDLKTRIRFPFNYWNEESAVVFGNNLDIERDFKLTSLIGSFRGCVRNVIVNSRLIDWSDQGNLVNIEAGCYNYKFPPSVLSSADPSAVQLNGDGCLRYSASNVHMPRKESIELFFKTNRDKMALVDSLGGEFLIHLQGPGVVIRNKDDTSSKILMQRGISFNDGNMHKLELLKNGNSVTMVLDDKYKTDFLLSNSRSQLPDFYLGCARDRRLTLKLIEVDDFVGTIHNIIYTSNNKPSNLLHSLTDNNSPLVEGNISWNTTSRQNNRISNAVTFKDSKSFLKLENLNFDIGSSLKFSFKTNEPNGLLGLITPSTPFYSTSKTSRNLIIPNYIGIELVEGIPSLLINLGNNVVNRLKCKTRELNDNRWHKIEVKRERLGSPNTEQGASTPTITFTCDDSNSRIKVDEEQKFSFSMFTAGNVTGNSEHNLPNELWHSKNSRFHGCIGDFELTGKKIDLFQSTSDESRSSLVNGCQHDRTGQCHTMFGCMNQGECVEGFSRAYCNCDSVSFTGERCEIAASTLTFNGTQGLEYSLVNLDKISSEDITLRFRTPLRSGVLFALKKFENQPSLVISLEDGRVKVVYDRGINDKVIYLGEPDGFNNNRWHTVNVKRYSSFVDVTVVDDRMNSYYVSDDMGKDFKYVTYRFIEIGSIASHNLNSENPNFIGWIQSVKFNGDELLKYYIDKHIKNKPGQIEGSAEIGENSLLMHHQLTFTSDCPVVFTPKLKASEKFNVRLYFKTSHPDGVLFMRQGKNNRFIALELSNGILRFIFELGGGIKVLESEITLNDKNWHEVTLKRFDQRKFSMKIDEFSESLIDAGTNTPKLADIDSLVVGGVTPSQKYLKTGLNNKGYMGCMASVEVNNEAVDLYSSRLNLCSSVQRGCVDSVCNPNPCSNNGVCEIVNNQVSCDCKMTSYSGSLCRDDSKFYFFGGPDANSKTCGLVKYTLDVNQVNKESDNLSFGFTTTIADALLIRIESETGDQFVEIKLKGGFVVLEININGVLEQKEYLPSSSKQFNDNRYYVVQYKRVRNSITFRLDNFDKLEFDLEGNGSGLFHSAYVYAGSSQENGNFLYCYYGVMSGMVLNGHSILDIGIKTGSVATVDSKYISEENLNSTRYIDLLPDGYCPLGYNKSNYLCIFVGCPLFSDFLGDYTCRCYYSFYHISNGVNECRKINETIVEPVLQYNNKFIPAKAMVAETPLGLILGIISGVGLALLAAAIGARKCADGLCIPVKKKPVAVAVPLVQTNTVTSTSDSLMVNRRQEQSIPLLHRDEQRFEEQYARDTLDFGYRAPYQQVTEVTEMYEQTLGGPNGTTLVTSVMPTTVQTYHTDASSHQMSQHHSTSHRNLAMDSLVYAQNNNATEYELANVTCVTMTPNGKYAIIGQSNGTPQIWDTISGQLIRSMGGSCANCTNLTLACNGTLLVGLANDGTSDNHAQSLQVWEVQTGKPILMSHQIKCCVFALSADTNSIFMAGNQRFGRGISVGILDLVSNELTKEIKSDPTISFGDNPESIVVTPDERHAVVGCRSLSGTNFIVFDITKSTEIAQTRSIALDADPKCIVGLSNTDVVTGTRGGHLIQWNIHSCAPSFTFEDPADMQAHRSSINQISISSDHEYIVSASSDCTGKIWSTRNKMLVSILAGHRAEVTCASISNNDLVVTGSNDQTVNLWRLHNGSQISSMAVNMNLIEANMAKHNKTIVAIGEKDSEQQLLMLRVVSIQR